MAKKHRTISLSPNVESLAQRVGNVSDYLSRVVEMRWQSWTGAHRQLVAEGWRPNEILATCDALNGVWLLGEPYSHPSSVALELHDAERINGLCAKWDVAPKRWTEHVDQVRVDASLASALRIVVEEFWTGNQACESAIRAGKEA